MRKVQVFKWDQQVIKGRPTSVKVADFTGTLHQFSQDDNGAGESIPVAIVETSDGRVLSVYCELIQFLEPALVSTLQRLDGYMDAAQYGADHPWRIEIREALAASGAA